MREQEIKDKERWKKVDPMYGNYSVSDLGRLRNDTTGRILVGGYTGWTRYTLWNLHNKGKRYQVTAHRMVWMTWMGDIPSNREINHINHIRTDNRLRNLELCTHRENCLRKSGAMSPRGLGQRVSYVAKRPMSLEQRDKHRDIMLNYYQSKSKHK